MNTTFAAAMLAVLAIPMLAGCLSGKTTTSTTPGPDHSSAILSPAIYKAKAPQEMWIPSSVDGKKINAAVYSPDTNETVPVFINFSPYWGDTAMSEGDAFSQYMVHEYVPRGFAVVLSAVRGTGHSEGCFQIGGDLELKDSYDVIDYFSKQPWSNGNVGAGGKSYDSTTQNGVIAKFPHPALKTIFHVSGITDMYRYNGKDGVTYSNGLTFNTLYYGQGVDEYGIPGAGTGGGGSGDESPASLLRAGDDAACTELPREQSSGIGTAGSGLKDAYWQERDWVHFLPQSSWNGSVFFVHGLQDWNVKPDNIDPWVDELQAKGIEVKGWLHQWQQAGTGHVYPMRTDWNVTMLRWLDHYLKGRDNGINQELGFDVMGSDETWRHESVWPPAANWTSMDVGTGKVANTFGPTKMTERYAGVPYAKVTVTPASADGVVDAILYDEGPDGTLTWINEGVKRLALNVDSTKPAPYVPGMPMEVNVTFYPMDIEVAGDHRLYLELNPSSPTGGGNAGFLIRPDQLQVVSFGGATLMMPKVGLDNVLSMQPTPMRCFTC